jgi:hypothetical protein
MGISSQSCVRPLSLGRKPMISVGLEEGRDAERGIEPPLCDCPARGLATIPTEALRCEEAKSADTNLLYVYT